MSTIIMTENAAVDTIMTTTNIIMIMTENVAVDTITITRNMNITMTMTENVAAVITMTITMACVAADIITTMRAIIMPDDVFTSWGVETAHKFTEDELKEILDKLAKGGEYGEVLRAKGIVTPAEGEWFHFDLVPEETELRRGAADYTGRICVIGANLNEDKLKELFHV